MNTKNKIRPGDHVRHIVSGDVWVVLWANHETGYFAPAGWPPGQCKIADVTIDHTATDDESREFLDRVEKALERGEHWPDGARAMRLHRPEKIPAGFRDDESPPVKTAEPHKIRAGDLVRFPEPGSGTQKESMVIYADYATGWLAPACAGDAWEIQISACELVTAATDEQHQGILDRFARLISKGVQLLAGARALEIYRPEIYGPKPATPVRPEEITILQDLCLEGARRATSAAIDVAKLADPRDGGSVMYSAAFKLILHAAASFAALKHRDAVRALNFNDPMTVEIVHAIGKSLALYPDTVAMDAFFAKAIGAELVS